MKIINPIKIKNYKGNIFKYSLKEIFFKKKIRDFYFTEIKKNFIKGWKLKDRETVLIVISGEVKIEIIEKNIRLIRLFKSKDKQIIIIPKKKKFRFSAPHKKSQLLSFLNEIY